MPALKHEDYAEYETEISCVVFGLSNAVPALNKLWSTGGPSLDAMEIVHDDQGRLRRGLILVEAKITYWNYTRTIARQREPRNEKAH